MLMRYSPKIPSDNNCTEDSVVIKTVIVVKPIKPILPLRYSTTKYTESKALIKKKNIPRNVAILKGLTE